MKSSVSLLFVLSYFSFSLASDVLEFKDSDFEARVKEHSVILVEFFAPWCGHCKRLAPEYEQAATTLKNSDPPLSIAKVDCTAETKTCEKYGVSGYPTLKVFKNGEFAFEYNGERNADGIVKYMLAKSGPSTKEITDVAALEKFTSGANSVVVGFFDKEGSDIESTFKKVADSLNEDIRFGHTYNAEVLSKFGYKDDIVIFLPKKLHSKFEDKQKKYTGDAAEHKIKSWIFEQGQGIMGHRQASTMKFFDKKPIIVAYYDVDYEKNPKGTNYWRNRLMKVARKFLDGGKDLHFAVSSSKEMSYEMNEYGVEAPDNTKVYVIARDITDKKFKMDADFSMDTFEDFMNKFLEGKMTPYLKSEPVPEKNDEPVKVVVAKNFDEIVNNPDKDVLIEFYAPWCGHCKSLAPKYDELAKTLEKEDEIVIAKMDATANDVPSAYAVSGFPTLYFAPKGSKASPKQYSGGREVKDFIEYLARESTNPLQGYERNGKEKRTDL